MNSFKFVNKRNKTALVLKTTKGQELCNREISILNDGFEGFLPLRASGIGMKYQLEFDLMGKVSVPQFFQGVTLSQSLFVAFVKKVYICVRNANRVHLNAEKIVWDINHVFVEQDSMDLAFVFVPLQPFERIGTLKEFFLSFLDIVTIDENEDLLYLQMFADILNKNSFVTTIMLEGYISRFNEDFVLSTEEASFNRCPECNSRVSENEDYCLACGRKMKQESVNCFSEADAYKKTYRKNVPIGFPCLHGTNMDIVITHTPFSIGKVEGINDFCIDSNVISRQHVQLTCLDNDYYITDLDSTNGTIVNGRRIQPTEKAKLSDGDRIVLAMIEFIYRK